MSIARGNSSDNGSAHNGNFSYSYTCGAGTNRILLVGIYFDTGSNQISAITYNGQGLTKLAENASLSASSRWFQLWYRIAPATGANTLAVTSTATNAWITVADYSAVSQSGFPDASNTSASGAGVTSLTAAVTTVANNAWLFGVFIGNSQAISAGTNTSLVKATAGLNAGIFDSNAPEIPAGSFSLQVTSASQNLAAIVVSFAPDVTTLLFTKAETVSCTETKSLIKTIILAFTESITSSDTIRYLTDRWKGQSKSSSTWTSQNKSL